jgi:Heme/copper-type cytochrome/quinol oxidases, subunit 1
MLNEMLGKFHFWVTFLGAYAIYFPMHYLACWVCRAGISRWAIWLSFRNRPRR